MTRSLAFLSRRRRFLSALLVLALVTGPALPSFAAQEQQPQGTGTRERPQPSQELSETLAKLQQAGGENYDLIIQTLAPLLAKANKESYDAALISLAMAQAHLRRGKKEDYAAAVPLLEHVVNSGHFRDDKNRYLDFVSILAQVYYSQDRFADAEKYAKMYLDQVEKPLTERIVFYCYVVLQRAQPAQGKVDEAAVREVLKQLDRALTSTLNPPENVYVLRALSYQVLGDFYKASETLELLVSKYPQNKQYWQQLFSAYANSGEPLRAILAIERGQEAGQMDTPQENLRLVSLYYNLQHYDKVIELLESGLKSGKLDNEPANYELLGAAYQFVHKEFKALETYKVASEKFPKVGKFDYLSTIIYWGMDKMPEALHHLERALASGSLEQPGQAYLWATYMALDQKQFEKARGFLEKAEPLVKEGREKSDWQGLKNALDEVDRAKEQEQQQKQEAEQQKSQSQQKSSKSSPPKDGAANKTPAQPAAPKK